MAQRSIMLWLGSQWQRGATRPEHPEATDLALAEIASEEQEEPASKETSAPKRQRAPSQMVAPAEEEEQASTTMSGTESDDVERPDSVRKVPLYYVKNLLPWEAKSAARAVANQRYQQQQKQRQECVPASHKVQEEVTHNCRRHPPQPGQYHPYLRK